MRLSFIIIFFLFPLFAFCQEHNFVILNVKGTATVNAGGKKTPAKTGLWLSGTEEIAVTNKSEITLLCKEKGYILLNKQGTYRPAEYNTKCQPSKTNILSNYMKFCWEEFSHHEAGTDMAHQQHMDNVGAAVRGRSKCYAIIDSSFKMVNYCQGNFELVWQKNTAAPLHFKVYEYPDGGRAIIDVPVSANTYALSNLTGILKKGTDYFWTLLPYDKPEECQRNHLQIWDKDDYAMLLKSYKDEVATMTTDKANEAYMLGYLLEGTHFYAEAMYYYNEAVRLAPENVQYTNTLKAYKKLLEPSKSK